MSFCSTPFQSIEDDLNAWNNLEKSVKDLYLEATELVQRAQVNEATTARLYQIFNDNANVDVNKNLVSCYGETLLYQSVQKENKKLVQVLLELGADPDAKNSMDGETPVESLQMLDGDEYEDRNETQEEILKMLLKAKEGSAAVGHAHQAREIVADTGQEVWDAYKTKLWAMGVDPAEVEEWQERLEARPDCIFTKMYLSNLSEKLQQVEDNDPQELDFLARRNKYKHDAKQQHKELREEKSALIKEAFTMLEITEEEGLNVESGDALVTRFKEIYSMPGVSVTVPSPGGQTLLMQTTANYVLEEKYPDSQLELVRFLLEKGCDPNVEDCIGSTAQDHLDYEYDYKKLTPQQKEIIDLLKDAGALIQGFDDQGKRIGKRGESVSRHEKARLAAEEEDEQEATSKGGLKRPAPC